MEGGPIPINQVFWYSLDILGLDDEAADIFATVICAMDEVYLAWMQKENAKNAKNNASSAASPKTGSSGRAR